MAEQSRKQRRKRRKRQKDTAKNIFQKIILWIFILTMAAALFLYINENHLHIDGVPTFSQLMQMTGLRKRPVLNAEDGDVSVHFLNVGQADCALIITPQKTVLIDCGEDSEAGYVIDYLRHFGVKRLDYVIGTHPHSDHIGGMYRVLEAFEIGEFIMPEVPEDKVPTTSFYEKLLDVIERNNISAYYSKVGQEISLYDDTAIRILGPLGIEYDDLNDNSIVTKLTCGEVDFLFMGDAEKNSEYELLDHWLDLSADVLKVGHHGSSSSSTLAFLKRVRPQYAVISVGRDNSYDHPKNETLERLSLIGAEILTTMEMGDIVFVTDGKGLTCTCSNAEILQQKGIA